MEKVRELWRNNPLTLIMVLAAIVRLVSVIFSKGWGMHDDHFLVIEPAQSWIDHTDYNGWLPMFNIHAQPSGHSLLYPGLHYLLFSFFEFLGIRDPQTKMYLVRFLHAAFSLITVYLGFKITESLSDKKTAAKTGLLLALFWFMPFFSVRNLVELVCIPFLVYGIWLILKSKNNDWNPWLVLSAGLILGVGFSIRFQTFTFVAGLGLALLFMKRWREMFILGIGYLISIAVIQGGIDYAIWHKPFAEFQEYTRYNMAFAHSYIVNSWYTYILLITGVLIPPISFFLIFGFFRNWKKHLIIFLPTFLFFVFHSIFPNKQERFIFPAIPFIIILGTVGWTSFVENSAYWKRNQKLSTYFWTFFWVVNTIALIPASTWYSKRARVESMTCISQYPNIKNILLEDSNHDSAKYPPEFYLRQWIDVKAITVSHTWDEYEKFLKNAPKDAAPRFVLFSENTNLESRVKRVKSIIPNLTFEAEAQPGFMDKLLHWLNPMNANQTIYIYRNTDFFPEKK